MKPTLRRTKIVATIGQRALDFGGDMILSKSELVTAGS
jgi:hypothetical protein